MRKLVLSLILTCISLSVLLAQTVTGKVVDSDTGEGLPGATVSIKGTSEGTVTDVDGSFSLNVSGMDVELEISFVGFQTITLPASADLGSVRLDAASVGLEEVMVMASYAQDRKTPVAVSTLRAKQIEERVGNQEFPEVLRYTPSIYATKQGGGFGDARINVRGFDQRNTAVMINGIPVNDMENGWVYWSNWAGLADVSSGIQVQRGLSASKLAVSSVGGTINIITKAADLKKGGSAYISMGNDAYQKYGVSYNTGLLSSGWAASVQATRTQGDGYIDGTQFSAWSYFASISKTINDQHTVVLTGLGAPQWHHQRLWSRFDDITLDDYKNDPDRGTKYNDLWGTLDGDEFSWRRNFYHKPKFFLNHYFDISDNARLNTSAYFSLGNGGGTGPRGRGAGFRFDSHPQWRNADGTVRWDDIVTWQSNSPNSGFETEFDTTSFDPAVGNYTTSSGDGLIRRASMNFHTWTGILSTFDTDLTENLNLTVGFDGRYYKGEHFRRVENLLGLDAYESRSNDNQPSNFITQEDAADFGNFRTDTYKSGSNPNVLNYWNDGLVSWFGLFTQLEYSTNNLSAFVALSGSNQGYKRIDYFNYLDSDPEQETDWERINGGTVKAGANYNINANHNIYAYGGYLSRQPLFDAVYVNFQNDLNEDYENENITSFEIGYGYTSRFLNIKLNLYSTNWGNRFVDQSQPDGPNQQDVLYSYVIDQTHQGVEVEVFANPIDKLEVRGMLTLGNWRYTDDFTGTGANTDSTADQTVYTSTLELKDEKIGDAAQTAISLGASYEAIDGLFINLDYIYYDNLFAQWSAGDDLSEGVWQIPSYSLLDLGFSYNVFSNDNLRVQLRGNVNNVLDEEYISEMFTNNHGPDRGDGLPYTIYDNEGYFGFGRTWNATVKVSF